MGCGAVDANPELNRQRRLSPGGSMCSEKSFTITVAKTNTRYSMASQGSQSNLVAAKEVAKYQMVVESDDEVVQTKLPDHSSLGPASPTSPESPQKLVEEFMFSDFKLDNEPTPVYRRGRSRSRLENSGRRASSGSNGEQPSYFMLNDFRVKVTDEVDDPRFAQSFFLNDVGHQIQGKGFKSCTIRNGPGSHTRIRTLAMHPSQRAYLAGCGDETSIAVNYFDRAAPSMTVEAHQFAISCAAFSKNGRVFATGSKDCSVIVWEVQLFSNTQKKLASIDHDATVPFCIAVSPKGSEVVTGSVDRLCRVYTVSGRLQLLYEKHTSNVTCVKFHDDGARVISGSIDCKVYVWDMEDGYTQFCFEGHQKPVFCISLARGGDLVLTNDERVALLWDVEKGTVMKKFEAHAIVGDDSSHNKHKPVTNPQNCKYGMLPNSVVSSRATLRSQALATKALFTQSSWIIDSNDVQFFVVASSNRSVSIVSTLTGMVEYSFVTRGIPFVVSGSSRGTAVIGDTCGNVYEVIAQ